MSRIEPMPPLEGAFPQGLPPLPPGFFARHPRIGAVLHLAWGLVFLAWLVRVLERDGFDWFTVGALIVLSAGLGASIATFPRRAGNEITTPQL
ncbi:hypothetical protein [Knoellia subterranea]|uniref:Uncharacterized protein n=1 Tax=Knoellia subterranea KCTC 19937 TaxID=1385521 RepID=A0A0A0JJL5_9MICO|nr:hypothetical protein [Knoellia subterranea]KGN37288.1 hypothetical protein N803_14845 [Knoellia subterranea KCTC 19937]